MANLEKIAQDKKGKKGHKKVGGMQAAVAQTEEIRKWVGYSSNF